MIVPCDLLQRLSGHCLRHPPSKLWASGQRAREGAPKCRRLLLQSRQHVLLVGVATREATPQSSAESRECVSCAGRRLCKAVGSGLPVASCHMSQPGWAVPLSAGQPVMCSQQLPGGPDISRLAARLQQEWDHERNAHLGPIKITPGSPKEAWWTQGLCQSGQPHRWSAEIRSRSQGKGSPYGLRGKAACPCNDLAHNYPVIAAEFDPDPGDPRTAESFRAQSNKKVPWRCGVCSHRWQAAISNRTTKHTGCPECGNTARRKPRNTYPTIADGRPDLLAEWDHRRNSQEGWHPDKVTLKSGRPIHWIRTDECRLGLPHQWRASPCNRVQKSTGSPFLSGKAVCVCNSLALNCKDAAALWDSELNDVSSDQVAAQSSRLACWRTPDGRQWQQRIKEVVKLCRRRELSL